MPKQKRCEQQHDSKQINLPLVFFAYPNSECTDFNHFDASNLQRRDWSEQRNSVLGSAFDVYKQNKALSRIMR